MNAENTPPPDRNDEPGADADIDEIQADIEKTRDELGQTVEALAAKADVKARAERKLTETKERLSEQASHTGEVVADKAHAAQLATREALTTDTGTVKPAVPVAALIAAGALIIGVVLWRRRR
ncbi:DUF3618 domain-containing protein [[Mycobacterium] burgundiense]|uniref:DUF3618 domain-containing protein n=1 Tax=[Mycobacterium] burgundiense TaxID=3064286 RepID=A0ABM9M6X7_9MYCO|nr:DUF3618 domain-containing protein [Mycolicibacterium sp. MU0053]CAJ1510960.1 DUF3618 domain-containing protein [Mycolicibacterium sp. MU0053]